MADNKRDHLNDMIAQWAPLINKHAVKLQKAGLPPHVDITDLHTSGTHGLIDAFHKYSPERGSFSNYAEHRIKGMMRDHIKNSGGVNAIDNQYYKHAKNFMDTERAKLNTPNEDEEDV